MISKVDEHHSKVIITVKYIFYIRKKVKSSMARSLPVENLLPQNVGSIQLLAVMY